jgi:DNA-directed RNA polymerase specialized sigma24 family protein
MPLAQATQNSRQKSPRPFTSGDTTIVAHEKNSLPRRQQHIVQMRFWDGLSTTEIALVKSLDWETVHGDLHSALTTLRTRCLAHPEFSRAVQQAQ